MNKQIMFTTEDIYKPDFGKEKSVKKALFWLVGSAFFVYIIVVIFSWSRSGEFDLLLQEFVEILFFFMIMGMGYHSLQSKKKRIETAIQYVVDNGHVISVYPKLDQLSRPIEKRDNSQILNYGASSALTGKTRFYNVKADYEGKEVLMPYIASDALPEMANDQTVRALYSQDYPDYAFMLKNQSSKSAFSHSPV